jgi:heptose I phosphotransferase
MIKLRADLSRHLPQEETSAFDRVMALEGETFRALGGRRTLRVILGGRSYFAKLHDGVGWREIVKNLLMLRRPVLGARDEWRAIQRFEELGVATMTIAGFGERGVLPSRRQSFLVTDELVGTVSLEDFCREWPTLPPPAALKRALIEKLATIAKTLHHHGVNHRDFYLCHFLLAKDTVRAPFAAAGLSVYVIDLHRVQIRSRTPQRWIEKDVAALHFSSMDIGLTLRDRLRFIRHYRDLPLRQVLAEEQGFWSGVERKAQRLYRQHC